MDTGFLQTIHFYLRYASYLLLAAGVGIYAYYRLRCWLTAGLRERYDFVSIYEIPFLQIVLPLMALAVLMYLNTLLPYTGWIYFSLGLAAVASLGTLFAYVAGNFLKLYYPFHLEKKLRKLRFRPRISREGRQMRLLSEEEEDDYLDQGMQAEETLFSVDYDVWIDDTSGQTKIERYDGKLYVEKCPSCGYLTLKIRSEQSVEHNGKATGVVKYYTCRHCGHTLHKTLSFVGGGRARVDVAKGNP